MLTTSTYIFFEIVNNANVDCLQKGINDLCTWAEKWQLKLSVDKCFHLRVGLIKSVPNLYLKGVLPSVMFFYCL